MAITIDYTTRIISIKKVDLTLIQTTPFEIYELDINSFRLSLKDIEDNIGGVPFVDTHKHNTAVTIGGVTLARVFQIINGYTVTFEDGAYAVNLINANSNIGDVINLNQVQVRSANSAGLANISVSEYAAFGGGVWVDVASTEVGTIFPIGTQEAPTNNLADALIIAVVRGFKTIYLASDFTFGATDNIDSYRIVGEGVGVTNCIITSGCSTSNVRFEKARVTGDADGAISAKDCILEDLTGVGCTINQMVWEFTIFIGIITLRSDNTIPLYMNNCNSGVAGTLTPTLDINNTDSDLSIRNYSGGLTIDNNNKTNNCSIDLSSGQVVLNSTVSAGTFVIRGVGKITNNSTGATVDVDSLINKETIALANAAHNGIAQGSGTGNNQIQLDTGASATDGAYDPSLILIRSGTGAGQSRLILQYDGTAKTATVDRNWKVSPDSTSKFAILPDSGREHVHEGLAQSATSTTITLGVLASGTNNLYVGQLIFIRSGTGDDQARRITAYDGTTKVATVATWSVTPDSTSAYVMLAATESTAGDIVNAVWDEATIGHVTAGTTGKALIDAGAAGNPWDSPVSGSTTAGTFGELVGKKMLTVAKFLGLK
ncbi:MAG: hypothetical protein ACI9GH_000166 [Candidatus Paceibacteria bacterium]|jgi:hypothetical protein